MENLAKSTVILRDLIQFLHKFINQKIKEITLDNIKELIDKFELINIQKLALSTKIQAIYTWNFYRNGLHTNPQGNFNI